MIRFALALIPLVVGILLAVIWQRGDLLNPIVYLRADIGTLFLLLGALGAVAVAGIVAAGERRRRAVAAATAALGAEEADSRRRFIRRLDHEVKNPLTAMRAAMANLNGAVDPQTMRSLGGQVDRLARLSADLRKLTDLEIQPLEQDEVDLGALLTELVEIARDRPEACCRRITLTVPQAPWPIAPVPGDRDLLFLAFHNLMDNAFKFTAEGATVEIRAYEDGASVAVEVADTGPGVPPDELPHLGEELYRGGARDRGGRQRVGVGPGEGNCRPSQRQHDHPQPAWPRHGRNREIAGGAPLMRRAAQLFTLLALLTLLTACAGTLAVGFEQTPTPDPAPAATLQALAEDNERLTVALATALAPPPPAPTALGRVAYIRGGDLWLTQLPEGPHQRLTIDGHNREPRISNSGEWIAYRKDRTVLIERDRPCEDPLREGQPPCRESVSTFQQQVWLARRSGAEQHVINRGFTVERFAWSPTNDLLAYVTNAGHLQTLDPATDIGLRLVTAQASGRVNAIAWSPDGLRLAYEWVSDDQSGTGSNREDGIWVIPATGGPGMRLFRGAEITREPRGVARSRACPDLAASGG